MPRMIDADKLEAKCKEIIAQEREYGTATVSWAHAYESFLDMLETALEIKADNYFDAVDRIKPCPNCRYTLMGMLDTGEDNNVPTKWHPASEPPTEAGEYIVMIGGAANATTLLYSELGDWFEEVDGYPEYYHVTHWMPLPEPPKEDEDEKV